MKKMIVSLMLILSMFAFAAESDPSDTVGYVKYDLLCPSSGYNMVAVPVDEGFTMSNNLGDDIASCNQVNYYDATAQGWVSSGKGVFGWTNPFAIGTGMGLQVHVTAPSSFISDGDVVADSQYNLLCPSSGYNVIMHPLTYSGTDWDMSNEIGDDITNCNQMNYYDAAAQGWVSSGKGVFGWTNPFSTDIGDGLQVHVTAPTTWPSTKEYDLVDGETPEVPKGDPKNVFYACVDEFGATFDFSGAPYDNVTFKAWITTRPGEILQEFSAGSGYTALGPYSAVFVNIGNFASPWSPGEFVTFWVRDETGGLGSYLDGGATTLLPLDLGGGDHYNGVEAFVPGSGPEISVSTPSSIEDGMIPEVTQLHQNYPNPFNPATAIKFDLAANTDVKLNVYNYNGQMVKSLVSGPMNAGYHTVNFDASNLSAGVYYYTLEADSKVMTNKMVLVK